MKDRQDKEKNELLQFLCSKDVEITYHSGRPSYGFCFQLAQRNYPEYKIILCNGDIYFNETLTKLVEYDLTGKFLALTRWDERSDSKLVPYRRMRRRDTTDSQDAWIFQLPLLPFEQDNIKWEYHFVIVELPIKQKKQVLRSLIHAKQFNVYMCTVHANEIIICVESYEKCVENLIWLYHGQC
ncbi:MAG TPA: hypothetical protein ENI08_02650 [Candidatus Dependentiae bacterium]|nr:hypothetical protein [Candidatus Dependentiae bacterium]